MKKLESYEIDFIKETYTDPAWQVGDIARKLEVCQHTISNYAKALGLKRPCIIRTPEADWEAIYYGRKSGIKYEPLADQVGVSVAGAKKIMAKMIAMSEAERIVRWNLYRRKHGRPLFSKC